MSNPRPKTKLDNPARSPLDSGATSSSFAGRRIDCDAAVSAAVIACCCKMPSAPAVTIVTAPRGHDQRPGGRLRAHALDRGPGARDAHEVEATRFGPLKTGGHLGAYRSCGGHGDPNPVRLGVMVGIAKRQGDPQAQQGRDNRNREQSSRAWRWHRTGGGGHLYVRRVRSNWGDVSFMMSAASFPGSVALVLCSS